MKEQVNLTGPEIIKPRGQVTIELFDKQSGELLQRTKKNNYVQQRIISAYAKINALQGFDNESGKEYTALYPYALYLTDYDGATNPDNENFLEGNTIGTAMRGYSAGGGVRGAWNDLESVTRTDYLKYVFDFPTSAANGTFQSIYTNTASNRAPAADYYFHNPLRLGYFTTPFEFNGMDKGNGKIYFFNFDIGKMYEVANLEITVGDDPSNFDYIEKEIPLVAFAGTVAGGSFYYRATSSEEIWKTNLGSSDPGVLVATLPERPLRFAYIQATDQFLVLNTTGGKIETYDKNFNLLRSQDNDLGNPGPRTLPVTDDGKRFAYENTFKNIETGLNESHVLGYKVNTTSYVNHFMELNNGIALYLQNSTYLLTAVQMCTAPTFFSRVLLDQPVTKTSQQNMKITYEFMISPISIFGPVV